MFTILADLLGSALKLWETKEKQKYIDEYLSLREQYEKEYNRPDGDRSAAVLDNLEFKLRLIAIAVTAGVGKPNALDKP